MPPPVSKYSRFTLSLNASHVVCFLKFFFILIILVTTARATVIWISRRKRRMSAPRLVPISSQEKMPALTSTTTAQEPKDYLQSLKEETLQPTQIPIWPWTAPPRQLPGPYDAPYYPPPPPPSNPGGYSEDPPIKLEEEETSNQISKDLSTGSTALCVSALSIANDENTRDHSATTSTHGWRRAQWSASSG